MKDRLSEIFNKAEKVKLDQEKKASIKESVLMFMKDNPMPESQIRMPKFWQVIFAKPAYVAISGLSLLMVVFGVASTQAQFALPGDILYPVKTGVNEKVLQVLAFSETAKISLNIKLAETRLMEAEKLAAQGKITENRQEQISKNFIAQTERLEKRIEKLTNEKKFSEAEKITSNFEVSLKAYGHVLEKLKDIEEKDIMSSLLNEVEKAGKRASDSSAFSLNGALSEPKETPVGLENITKERMQSAEQNVLEAKNLLESQKDKMDAGDFIKIEQNLIEAEEKIEQGRQKMQEDKNYAKALPLFQQAKIIAKKSVKLMEAKNDLMINIEMDINKNNKKD